jgi:cytochrome c
MNRFSRLPGLLGVLFFLVCSGIALGQGQFSFPGCADIAESQFKYVPLVGKSTSTQTKALAIDNALSEPIHMAFDLQANNKVDVYFTQRDGTVKKFSGADNTVSTIGNITVTTSSEMGLTGIALDPAFKANSWVYLFYAIASELRLSRFTLTAGKLGTDTEKRILTYRRVTGAHMGGALAFDSNGDLWISTGNDASDYPGAYNESSEGGSSEASSGNMNDLRGGVLRIHPDNSAKGYSVPAGNFSDYWSAYFKDKGNATLAAEYADPAKVKPELYVKGTRNAYSIAVDPIKHWVAFGSIGVNVTTSISEAHFLLTRPAFIGYPYFAGGFGTEPGTGYYALWSGEGASNFSSAHPGLTETNTAPVNNSKWNTGPKQLPPVTPGMHSYLRGTVGAAAVTGSFYRYDAASTSTIKFPPNFEGAWMITDWVQNNNVANPAGGGFRGIQFYKIKPTGDGLTDSLKLFQTYGITGPLDLQQGPDGALYVLNYGPAYFGTTGETKIARIEYTGTCRPTVAINRNPAGKTWLNRSGSSFEIDRRWPYSMTIRDVQGRMLARLEAQAGRKAYSIGRLVPAGTPQGILNVTLSGNDGPEIFRVYGD